MASARVKTRRREDYPYMLEYRTRWNDNDMYHHMNNSVYSFLFDSIINDFLVNRAGLHPPSSPEYAIIAHTETTFVSSIAYPAIAEVGVRVTHLGRSSVTYEVALFEKDVPGVKAVGGVVHVFVDRKSGKPVRGGMGERVRVALEGINLGPVAVVGEEEEDNDDNNKKKKKKSSSKL